MEDGLRVGRQDTGDRMIAYLLTRAERVRVGRETFVFKSVEYFVVDYSDVSGIAVVVAVPGRTVSTSQKGGRAKRKPLRGLSIYSTLLLFQTSLFARRQ